MTGEDACLPGFRDFLHSLLEVTNLIINTLQFRP